jgi:hypothetical protein
MIGRIVNRFAATACLIVALAATAAAGQAGPGTISGTVKDALKGADTSQPHKFVIRARNVARRVRL